MSDSILERPLDGVHITLATLYFQISTAFQNTHSLGNTHIGYLDSNHNISLCRINNKINILKMYQFLYFDVQLFI